MSELVVGDINPGLQLGPFIKGTPLRAIARGKVYVIDLWATTCGSCRASILHLSSLQNKYESVVFLGVMLKFFAGSPSVPSKWIDHTKYRLALDTENISSTTTEGWMQNHWFHAAHQTSIPVAFIVDQMGRIAWIGYSMNVEQPLAAVISGSWDLAAAAREHRQFIARSKIRQGLREGLREAVAVEDWQAVFSQIEHVIALDSEFAREAEFITHKLIALVCGGSGRLEMQAYVDTLIHDLNDPFVFAPVGARLLSRNDHPLELIKIGVQFMRQAEALFVGQARSGEIGPNGMLQFEGCLVQGLAKLGHYEEARTRALRIRQLSGRPEVDDDVRQRVLHDVERALLSFKP